jgi:hypothetical protein
MSNTLAIKLKATFMLFIFALNMLVGFACSIGSTGGNNAQLHQAEAEKKSNPAHSHEHGNVGKGHHHDKAKPHDHKTDHKDANDKKGCCNDEVQKIQQADKNININAKIIAVAVIGDITKSHYRPYPVILSTTNPAKLRERFFYPPPPNILLSIQRFQI